MHYYGICWMGNYDFRDLDFRFSSLSASFSPLPPSYLLVLHMMMVVRIDCAQVYMSSCIGGEPQIMETFSPFSTMIPYRHQLFPISTN